MDWKKDVEKFKTALKVEAPSMAGSYLRVGFFGLTGGGKSVTSGIFAIGITPEGPIGWIDGEGRRSGYAIDEVAEMAAKYYRTTKEAIKERFRVVHVEPPFNPLQGVAAIETLEEAGCKTIICDLCSQLWDSEGGYLDMKEETLDRMAGTDEAKRLRSLAAAAAAVKPWTHAKFVAKATNAKANMILIFQAKNKWNPKENKVDQFVSPIQEGGLTRTALIVGRVEANDKGQGGYCNFAASPGQGTKYTHHGLYPLLPRPDEQLTFAHAEAIAKWVGVPVTAPLPDPQRPSPHKDLNGYKREIWDLTRHIHGCKKGITDKATLQAGIKPLNQYLWDENIISDTEEWSSLTLERMPDILAKLRAKLEQPELVP